jgi:hypothetical protein
LKVRKFLVSLALVTVSIFLLAAPFMVFWFLWVFLSPETFWQRLVGGVVVLVTSLMVAIPTWFVAIATLEEVLYEYRL